MRGEAGNRGTKWTLGQGLGAVVVGYCWVIIAASGYALPKWRYHMAVRIAGGGGPEGEA